MRWRVSCEVPMLRTIGASMHDAVFAVTALRRATGFPLEHGGSLGARGAARCAVVAERIAGIAEGADDGTHERGNELRISMEGFCSDSRKASSHGRTHVTSFLREASYMEIGTAKLEFAGSSGALLRCCNAISFCVRKVPKPVHVKPKNVAAFSGSSRNGLFGPSKKP